MKKSQLEVGTREFSDSSEGGAKSFWWQEGSRRRTHA